MLSWRACGSICLILGSSMMIAGCGGADSGPLVTPQEKESQAKATEDAFKEFQKQKPGESKAKPAPKRQKTNGVETSFSPVLAGERSA